MRFPKITSRRLSRVAANDDVVAVKSAWRRSTHWGALALVLLSVSALLVLGVFSFVTPELLPLALFFLPLVYFFAWSASASVVKFVYHLRRFLVLSEVNYPPHKWGGL